MELYQLRSFVAVADAGSLTRAAEHVHASQPAVSAHIKALEDELGVTLFARKPQGMALTAAGQTLLARARDTLQASTALKLLARELSQEVVGTPRIGLNSGPEFLRVGALRTALHQRHPRVVPHFIASSSLDIQADVQAGRLDGGYFFGAIASDGLRVVELADVPMRLVAPAAWAPRLSGRSLAALWHEPWVYTTERCPFYVLMRAVNPGVTQHPNVVAWVEQEDTVAAFVAAGTGLSLLRAEDAHRLAATGRACMLDVVLPPIKLSFAINAGAAQTPLGDALWHAARSVWLVGQEERNGNEGAMLYASNSGTAPDTPR